MPTSLAPLAPLLLGTVLLRPYVFAFLAVFAWAATRDLGAVRMLGFLAWGFAVAFTAEYASTRVGVPFGLYHYTGTTRGQELFIADVPFMDSLSFTFLAYAAFCLARGVLAGRRVPAPVMALVAGVLMMLLDVVIDPLAVRGDRWFLGRIFFYPDGGMYFGVPLANFAGWVVVGTLGVGGYLALGRWAGWTAMSGRLTWPGIALYYAVFAFNLTVTAWIGEWLLVAVGGMVHLATALVLWSVSQRPAERLGLEKQQA